MITIDTYVKHAFKDLAILDNFYQTSSFFPMPVIAVATLSEDGRTNVGPYSLCFPYYVAGKDYHAMLLCTRNDSNTAKNILRTKKCTLNFLPDDKKLMKECVRLGFPGETTEEKMQGNFFTFSNGLMKENDPEGEYPMIVNESFQVFECTWDSSLDGADNDKVQEAYEPPFHNFNGITSTKGAHFILKIENILIKDIYRKALIDGVKNKSFPNVPVDYGFRDNTKFWFSSFRKPYAEDLPSGKGVDLNAVRYAAERIVTDVKFSDDALVKLVKVPRIFLKKVLTDCAKWGEERGITTLDANHMDQIRDKRTEEKV